MEKYLLWIIGSLSLLFLPACSDNKVPEDIEVDDRIQIESLSLFLAGQETGENTRAENIPGYVVNTTTDPTASLTGREAWLLDVTIYKGGSPYADGSATFTMSGGDENIWESGTQIYFPNYLTQQAEVTLRPSTWTTSTPFITNQSATGGANLLAQDILEQNGSPTALIVPAHIPEVELRHAYSMLDFKLNNVNESEVTSVTVTINNQEYNPYQVMTGDNPEYLLIVPVGTSAPVINVTTNGGARYQQTVDGVTGTVVNNCYCFTLEGMELKLGEITIAEWTTGPGILGEYTTEESYPTFRGPAGVNAVLIYDNGLEQNVLFNEQGEATIRPAGRTLVRITAERWFYDLETPLILSSMVIDLSPYFDSFTS